MGGGSGMYMGWGGSSSDLKRAFFDPFADVVKTAFGKSRELLVKTKSLFKIVFNVLVSTLVPGLEGSYDEIAKQEAESIQRIRSQYKDVYDRTDAALSSGDATIMGLLYAPGAVFGSVLAKKGFEVASDLLGSVSGGASDRYVKESYRRGSRLLFEQDDEKSKLKAMLADKNVVAAMQKRLKPLVDNLIAVKQQKLDAVVEKAKEIINAKTVKDFEDAISKKSTDEMKQKILSTKGMQDLQPEQIDALFSELAKKSGQMLQNAFVIPLKKELESLKAAGAPDVLTKKYEEAIRTITTMSPS
jgi:hypothetical protein